MRELQRASSRANGVIAVCLACAAAACGQGSPAPIKPPGGHADVMASVDDASDVAEVDIVAHGDSGAATLDVASDAAVGADSEALDVTAPPDAGDVGSADEEVGDDSGLDGDGSAASAPDCQQPQSEGCPCGKEFDACCIKQDFGLFCTTWLPAMALTWIAVADCCADPSPMCAPWNDPAKFPPWCNGQTP